MRAHDDRRSRSVTLLSLQPLEPRTPLAANVTALVAPAVAKVVPIEMADVARVRVHAVATPLVVVEHGTLATAAKAATAAEEAARAAQAGHAMPDVSQVMADSLTEWLDRFGIAGGGNGSQRAATGVPGLELSVPGEADGIAAFRERYGLGGGGQPGGDGTESPEDVRAAAEAKKGMAAADTTCGKTPEQHKKKMEDYHDELLFKRFEHRQTCQHDENGHPRYKEFHDAQKKEMDATRRKAKECWDQVKKDEQEAAKKPKKGCPGPDDDRNTPPHRATPPGTRSAAPTPRPSLASRPVPDADAVVRRPAGSVRGQVPTNPALDHGRDALAPRGMVSAVNVRAAAFAALGRVINPLNTH